LREKDDVVHVRCIIKGEPARMIRELKRRGTYRITERGRRLLQAIAA